MYLRLKSLKMASCRRILAAIAAFVLIVCSCGRGRQTEKTTEEKSVPFPEVQVPGMITEPSERMEFVLDHFWDGLMSSSLKGRCDSTHVEGVLMAEVEKKFGLYVSILWEAPLDDAVKSVAKLFRDVEKREIQDTSSNVFGTMTKFMEKYLYDPNSPVRNEELYLPYVEGLSKSPLVPDTMRPAYSYDASMCSLNRIGTKAADFRFRDLRGRNYTLYGVKADYTLLFFANPGCPNCKEITEMIENSPGISELLSSGRLAVVDIYIDQEIDKWKAYAPEYPKEWLSGYDPDYIIRNDLIYNVRAIPSLYLLDMDKRVIMKDAPQDKVFEKLNSLL